MLPSVKVEVEKMGVAFGDNQVLRNVNLVIEHGVSAAIVGQSGKGKTTLLRVIAGLLEPTTGTVLAGDRPPKRHYGDGKIGFLFQEACLFPHLTLRGNLELAFHAQKRPVDEIKVTSQLASIGLAHAANLFPYQASVGMKARTAIARTLCFPPELLLMDEPLASLDPVRRLELNKLIRQVCKSIGATCVWTTHNVAEALLFADLIVALTPSNEIELFTTTHLPPITDEGNLPAAARELRDAIIHSTWQPAAFAAEIA